ncbi:MAG: signal peptide peptidase SppA [Elusimicrobiales bacterium]|nr:signal peptide peptidase SppA [Elusimicrobiales bacterium]
MEQNVKKEENLSPQPKKKNFNLLNFLIFILSFLYFITVIISIKVLSQRKIVFKDYEISKDIIKKSIGKVAVIPIYGVIYKRESSVSLRGSDYIVNMIKKYGEDNNIKAIVLDINSPGGSVGAVQEIYSMIMKIKKQYKKPFIAHFGDIAASGAYYIAAACDKIISNSGAITGSIGVIFTTMEGEVLLRKIGIRSNIIKSGKFKDIGSFAREMTKEERKLLEDMVNDTYNIFLEAVAKGRNIPIEKVREIADGRIFNGNQALSIGLVDKIGDLYDSIDEAGVMSGLGRNPPVVRAKGYILSDILSELDSKFNFINFFRNEFYFPFLEYRFAI